MSRLQRMLSAVGLFWLIGVLWWAGLMLFFGPTSQVLHDAQGWHERTYTVLDRTFYAPLVAIPWAAVGAIVGARWTASKDRRPIMSALAGVLIGGGLCLVTSPFDGWLTLSMPVYCLVAALIAAEVS
jgi:hypothetical protein